MNGDLGNGSGNWLDKALRKVPATKWILAAVALFSAGAMVFNYFNHDIAAAERIASVLMIFTIVFFVFAKVADLKEDSPANRFLVWFCLLVFVGGVSFLCYWEIRKLYPVETARDPREDALLRSFTELEAESGSDTFITYISDSGRMASLTIQYLHFIEGYPVADPDDKVYDAATRAFEPLEKANDKSRTGTIGGGSGHNKDMAEKYSVKIPGAFKNILVHLKIDKDKAARDRGFSGADVTCYESAIRRLFIVDAGFGPSPSTPESLHQAGFLDPAPTVPQSCPLYLRNLYQ